MKILKRDYPMKTNKKMKYFCGGLAVVTSLLLWSPLQGNAFSQSGGKGGVGVGNMAGESAAAGISGKVAETMDSGGYTYVLLDKSGVKTWVAIPQTKVVLGSEITCLSGAVMGNFNSTTLNRTFERIVFSPGLASASSAAAQTKTAAPSSAEAIKVSKSEAPTAQTIGEIFEKKDALANKPVAVQAKVVKLSSGIMGKNWLHLQDGTGNQAAGTNDLVVTTDALPKVGEVITVKGNLSLDRDFGGGYFYNVIIEGAEIAR